MPVIFSLLGINESNTASCSLRGSSHCLCFLSERMKELEIYLKLKIKEKNYIIRPRFYSPLLKPRRSPCSLDSF